MGFWVGNCSHGSTAKCLVLLCVVISMDWTISQAQRYLLLHKLAQRYLCVPGNIVSAERIFSTAGDIIAAHRSALTSKHADQLLFLKRNMHISG